MTDESKVSVEVETLEETTPQVETEAKAAPASKKASRKKSTKTSSEKKHGKKFQAMRQLVDTTKAYSLAEAVALAKKTSFTKFDATLELHLKLGVDPKKADQQVRGTVVLPHGTGKKVRILVIAEGDKAEEARKAGADHVGTEDMIAKIQEGWLDFDLVIATPNLMGKIGPLGRTLGTKGLMPSPKAGTVTFEVGRMVEEWKLGKVEYKLEKLPLIHTIAGKVSFVEEHLVENLRAIISAILKAKPASAKGMYLQSAFINVTMGPGIKLDVQELRDLR